MENSTQKSVYCDKDKLKTIRVSPKESTLEFLRNFARAYRATKDANGKGMVLFS